jgi:TRAP-type mannitol/chloroaromatic compound transport system permease small subunit
MPSSRLLAASDVLAWPCRALARVLGLMLLVLTAVILYDVIGRRFFATGSILLQELEWHLHGAIAILGFGYGYIHNAHVRIDVFAARLTDRTRLKVELWAIFLCLIPFMLVLIWFGAENTLRAFQRGEGSPGGMGLPHRWIIRSAIPLSGILTIVGALSVALRILHVLRGSARFPEPWEGR